MFFRHCLTSCSTQLTAMKDRSGQDIHHLASVVNKLDELGEILEEMLQIQDLVEVRSESRYWKSYLSSFPRFK